MELGPRRFDSVIVGTGQAGKPLASALADHGHHTAVIEKGRVGGTCVIDGCTPTKTMIASARVARLASRSSDYGVETGQVFIRMENVLARQRSVVDSFSSAGREVLVRNEGIELIGGTARFLDHHVLEVTPGHGWGDPVRITSERIFLDVGARPRIPPIDGLDDVDYLTSSTILGLAEVPRHLVVLGGGPIGVELGQMFSRFGAGVTIVERESWILGAEDHDVSDALRDVLEEEGITILTRAQAVRVAPTDNGGASISLETRDGTVELVASHLLIAVGRMPNSDLLDLEKAGLSVDENGYIPVDERCRTDVEGIWALGDVTGAPPFTHIAYDDYRVAAADVLPDRADRTRADRLVPYTIYSDPELGRVGLTEAEATELGRSVRVAKLPMTSWARAIEMDETAGFVKCLVDAETDRIVGVAALAVHGGEIMSVLQTAMMGDLPYTVIRDAIYAHPTLAEPVQNLLATLDA